MHTEQRTRTYALLQERGIDCALFANPHSITWLTGFYAPPQLGQHPFAGAPPLLWYEEGRFVLFVVDGYAEAAASLASEPGCEVVTHQGYTLDAPIDGLGHLLANLRQRWQGQRRALVGVESADVSTAVMLALNEALDPSGLATIDGWLKPLRMVKTDEEIAKLRANFHLTDVGHAAARSAVQTGVREIDVWAAIHSAIQHEAGCRVPLGNDCVAGTRLANIGGWPLAHALRPNDSLIVDLSTLLHGYWSDSCATYVAGDPPAQLLEMHAAVGEALALGASLLRPGAVACEVDRVLRQFVARAGYPVYPHHSGHAVGVSGHEAPRIVPDSQEVLQPNMVILLEPGIYLPGQMGVRLEDAFLITETGAEQLTHHEKQI
jgi:Xaa-Pro aminopeptidase